MTLEDDPPQVPSPPSPPRLATPDSGSSRGRQTGKTTNDIVGIELVTAPMGIPRRAGGRRGQWLEACESPIATTSPVDVVGQENVFSCFVLALSM